MRCGDHSSGSYLQIFLIIVVEREDLWFQEKKNKWLFEVSRLLDTRKHGGMSDLIGNHVNKYKCDKILTQYSHDLFLFRNSSILGASLS